MQVEKESFKLYINVDAFLLFVLIHNITIPTITIADITNNTNNVYPIIKLYKSKKLEIEARLVSDTLFASKKPYINY